MVPTQSRLSTQIPQPPVSLRPERLPLNGPGFPWPRFEAFCRYFVQVQPGVLHCRHYGVADGTTWAPQC